MVEHRNHNPLVGGSNPSPATKSRNHENPVNTGFSVFIRYRRKIAVPRVSTSTDEEDTRTILPERLPSTSTE